MKKPPLIRHASAYAYRIFNPEIPFKSLTLSRTHAFYKTGFTLDKAPSNTPP